VVQAKADVYWHQPIMSEITFASDLLRGRRQIEEPILSVMLWKRTPELCRWGLSEASLRHIAETTESDGEWQWANTLLSLRRGRPRAEDRGFDATAASHDRWKQELRGDPSAKRRAREARGKRG